MATQSKIGWRPYVNPYVSPSTLWSSIYSVWNADTLGTSLDTSIFRAYNGENATMTPTQLSTNIFGVWNADTLGTSLDTSIRAVYNGDNVNDTSGNAQNGTNVGGVTFTTGKVGNAFTFNGSNYVGLPDNSLKLIGDFSISLWINVNSIGGGANQALFGTYFYDGNTYGWRLDFINTTMRFAIFGSTQVDLSLSNTFNTGQWYHIVITRKASTGTKAYINGVLNVSNTSTINPNYATTQYTTIGATQYNASSVTYYLNGKLDAVNVWTKELTAGEVVNLYNSGNGTEYPFSTQTLASLNDSIGTNHGTTPASTLTGGVLGPAFTTGKIGKAFTFDGVNDYVSLPTNSLSSLTGDFSISCWVNLTSLTLVQCFLSNYIFTSGINDGYIGFRLYYNTTGGVRFEIGDINSVGTILSTNNYLTTNAWYNIVVTRKGSTRTKIYINGLQSVSNTDSRNPAYVTTYPAIGTAQYSSNNNTWFMSNGSKIDALNIWNRELTAEEITALYNSGNGQQYPFSSVTLSNSMLDSVNAQNGTLQGGLTLTTGKVGNAFTFNGTSAAVRLPDNSLNSLTGDFSISNWVYLPSTYLGTGGGTVYMLWNVTAPTWSPPTNLKGIALRITSNTIVGFTIWDGVSSATVSFNDGGSTYLKNSSWVHITATRKSSTGSKLYLNGVLVGSNTSTMNPVYSSTFQTPNIGNLRTTDSSGNVLINNDFAFNGTKIDGLTIWNKTLTDEEVFNLYNDGSGAEYPFTSQYLASLKDSVGSNDGTRPASTLTGGVLGPSFTTGKIGKAFNFDGINDYISLPTNSLNFTGDFSVSMWINVPTTSNQMTLINSHDYNGSIQSGWVLNLKGSTNQIIFEVYQGGGSSQSRYAITHGTSTYNGQWVNVVLTRKASTTTKIYVNGAAQSGTYLNGANTDNPTYGIACNCEIGADYRTGDGLQNISVAGTKIDALSVWSKELTASDVTELYNSGNGKQYPTT